MAKDSPFRFVWARSVGGYELKPEKRISARSLLTGSGGPQIVRRGDELDTYQPHATQALHRVFASIDDTPDAALAFVTEYGFLGISNKAAQQTSSESASEILSRKNELKSALEAVDDFLTFDRKVKKAGKDMRLEGKIPKHDPQQIRQIAAGLFNQWSSSHLAAMKIELIQSRAARNGVEMRVVPQSLLAYMWLCAAEEITEGAQFRLCVVCRNPINIKVGRADRVTCSGACRTALSRSSNKREERMQ